MSHNGHPRVSLSHLPTPIEAMPNLSAALGDAQILVKRDDCTGLAMGGNKARQLEYYFGAAHAMGADTVIITGAVQSNFLRMTAAAAAKLGMSCEIQHEERVSSMGADYHESGNVLLDRILGATIHHYPVGEDEAGADRALDEIAERCRAEGRKPYVIHLGMDHPPLGALGYVDAAKELLIQIEEQGLEIDLVVVPSGSGATHAGLLAGLLLEGSRLPVLGVCVRRSQEPQRERMRNRVAEIGALVGKRELEATESDLQFEDSVLAPGYGRLNEATHEAIALAARCEGLLVDPVYSGKTLAGLIAAIRGGSIAPDARVLFWHTGGTPAIFGYGSQL